MCELCDDDRLGIVGEPAAMVRVVDDQPQPISVLSEEITAQIGDIERHLDTERSDYIRKQLCDTMWALRWARENLLCLLDDTRVWQSQPTSGELFARYPHPDKQPK